MNSLGVAAERESRAQIDYAVLGLVIERASYGYEIWERFDALFGLALSASGPSGVYKALKRLLRAGLVRHAGIEAPVGAEGRPRIHYEATEQGEREHAAWLASLIHEVPGRTELLVRMAAARSEGDLLRIIEEYERWCLAEIAASDDLAPMGELRGSVVAEIFRDERRSRADAQLEWISRARRRLHARA